MFWHHSFVYDAFGHSVVCPTNPTVQVRERCLSFCQTLYDSTTASAVDPQPRHHSWWLQKINGPDQRLVRYKANSQQQLSPVAARSIQTTKLFMEIEKFPHHAAIQDLNNFFDSLPTKDCLTADCDSPIVRQTKKLSRPHTHFDQGQVRHYERKVLGYHRRQENAMESKELDQLGAESSAIVSGTMRGYDRLQQQAAVRDSSKSERRLSGPSEGRHSKAYDVARKRRGFVGYYDNVFSTKKNPSQGASVRSEPGNPKIAPVKSTSQGSSKAGKLSRRIHKNMHKVDSQLLRLKLERAQLLLKEGFKEWLAQRKTPSQSLTKRLPPTHGSNTRESDKRHINKPTLPISGSNQDMQAMADIANPEPSTYKQAGKVPSLADKSSTADSAKHIEVSLSPKIAANKAKETAAASGGRVPKLSGPDIATSPLHNRARRPSHEGAARPSHEGAAAAMTKISKVGELEKLRRATMERTAELLRRLQRDVGGASIATKAAAAAPSMGAASPANLQEMVQLSGNALTCVA